MEQQERHQWDGAGTGSTPSDLADGRPLFNSWNFFACDINAKVFERQIDALTNVSRLVNGKQTSLADLGYNTVGIDGEPEKRMCYNLLPL
jgi:hypothetical protein